MASRSESHGAPPPLRAPVPPPRQPDVLHQLKAKPCPRASDPRMRTAKEAAHCPAGEQRQQPAPAAPYRLSALFSARLAAAPLGAPAAQQRAAGLQEAPAGEEEEEEEEEEVEQQPPPPPQQQREQPQHRQQQMPPAPALEPASICLLDGLDWPLQLPEDVLRSYKESCGSKRAIEKIQKWAAVIVQVLQVGGAWNSA